MIKKESSNPKVSIVVAAYNIEKYIEKCLNSLINQTFKDIEIIVVNDGSRDNTLDKINQYVIKDKRVVVVNQVNKGLIEARKSGFMSISGEYVLFVDGDDWLELNTIELAYKKAKENDLDIVQFKYLMTYDDKDTKKDWDNTIGLLEGYELMEKCLLGTINHNACTKLIKTKFIKENNVKFPSNISYAEDLAFVFALAINKPRVYVMEEYLYNYYQRQTSLTNQISIKVLEIGEAINFVKQLLINNNLFDRYKEEFYYLAYRRNYYAMTDYIYYDKSGIGKSLLKNWRNMNIDIKNNRYYLELFKDKSKMTILLSNLIMDNYLIGKFYYKYKAK